MQRPACLALLAFLLAVLAPASSSAQSKRQPSASDKDKAQEHYKRAAAHHDRGEFEKAAEEYLAAHALFPDPEFYFLVAEAYDAHGDKRKALEYYERYLKEEPNGRVATKAREAKVRLERDIKILEEAERRKAEEEERRKKAEEEAARIKAEEAAKGKEEKDPDVGVEKGSPGKPGGGLRIGGLVTAGVGLLAIGVGVKFGLDARAAQSDVEEQWDEDRFDEGEAAERNMFVMYGIGAAAVVGGGILYYLGAKKGKSGSSEERLTVVPGVTGSSAAVILRGSF